MTNTHSSVRWKIFGPIAAVFVLYTVGQGVYISSVQEDQLESGLAHKGLSMSRLIAYQVRLAFEFRDSDKLVEAFKGAGGDPDFVFAAAFHPDGTMVQSHVKSGGQIPGGWRVENVVEATVVWQDDQLIAVAPILRAQREQAAVDNGLAALLGGGTDAQPVAVGAAVGILAVGLSKQTINDQLDAAMRTNLLLGLTLLAGALVVAMMIGLALSRRLGRIAAVAERVARGQLEDVNLQESSRDEVGQLAVSIDSMTRSLRNLATDMGQVADGDLSRTTSLSGDLPEAFNRMLVNQRELVKQIVSTAFQLSSAAGEFVANARQQEQGATAQSSAVAQTHRTMRSLLTSGEEISNASQSVLQNAERALQNSRVVAERIATLSSHTQRIAEILEVIKDIANKSDLLALNAALEGSKAGDSGRGFSLVATQMQRLAENVMGSVRDIKDLTVNIREATQASVLATEESTKFAGGTTTSARQIALIIQQQQSGTEQVIQAMDDVTRVASQTTAGSKEIVASANDLLALSDRLKELIGRFRLGAGSEGSDGQTDEA